MQTEAALPTKGVVQSVLKKLIPVADQLSGVKNGLSPYILILSMATPSPQPLVPVDLVVL